MRISLSWLQDFLPLTQSPQEIADALTGGGLEVEGLEEVAAVQGGLNHVVVGHVLEVKGHPGADRLRLCLVDVGLGDAVQIVCGAANVAQGQKVPVALPGAVLYTIGADEPIKIKAGKIRGELSGGMICAEDELGIGTGHEGIMVLEAGLAVGTPAAQALGLEADYIFEIGLTPNRGDAASHLGVARDLAALFKLQLNTQESGFSLPLEPSPYSVDIENAEDTPNYHAVLVENVQVGPSPEWLQKRLASVGLATINNVVDVTNYFCHHVGQPMHVFDADKLNGKKITVRRAGVPSQLSVLDKRTLTLHADDLVIADAAGPIALAGAMGGIETSVTEATTRVLLEVACFHPVAVRKTAARHALKTDSSFRFERGVDPELGQKAILLAAELLKDIANASISSSVAVAHGQPPTAKRFDVNKGRLTALIGQQLEEGLIEDILTRLGFSLTPIDGGFTIEVPSYRLYDVEGMADMAEEVIRIFGLNNLQLPASIGVRFFDTTPGWKTFDKATDISRQLATDGFVEFVTNSLTGLGQPTEDGDLQPVKLLNPLSEDLSQMRISPLPGTLQALAYNANRKQKALKTFEFGRIYGLAENGAYTERAYLCLALWGQPETTWQGKSEPYSFYNLSATVQKILARLGIKVNYAPADAAPYFSEVTSLKLGKKELALLGQVSPTLVKKADLKGAVYAAIVWWDVLMATTASPNFKAVEPPKFPEVRRDLSLVVDKGVTYAQLHTQALEAERKLLNEVQLFDVFEGDSLGDSKKAYALAFTLSLPDATLTDAQIDAAMQRLEASFVKLGATIRR